MELADYFKNTDGTGILATCDPAGEVDQAIYSKPYVVDAQTIAFIMKSQHTRHNLKRNIRACYLFLETGPDYKGIRLYLTLLHEEKSQSLLQTMRKKESALYADGQDADKYVVFFMVDRTRPLVGD